MVGVYDSKFKCLKIWSNVNTNSSKKKIIINHNIRAVPRLSESPNMVSRKHIFCTHIISLSFRFEKSLPILFYIHYVHQRQMGKSKYTGRVRQGVQSTSCWRIREYLLIYIILYLPSAAWRTWHFSKATS